MCGGKVVSLSLKQRALLEKTRSIADAVLQDWRPEEQEKWTAWRLVGQLIEDYDFSVGVLKTICNLTLLHTGPGGQCIE